MSGCGFGQLGYGYIRKVFVFRKVGWINFEGNIMF